MGRAQRAEKASAGGVGWRVGRAQRAEKASADTKPAAGRGGAAVERGRGRGGWVERSEPKKRARVRQGRRVERREPKKRARTRSRPQAAEGQQSSAGGAGAGGPSAASRKSERGHEAGRRPRRGSSRARAGQGRVGRAPRAEKASADTKPAAGRGGAAVERGRGRGGWAERSEPKKRARAGLTHAAMLTSQAPAPTTQTLKRIASVGSAEPATIARRRARRPMSG